MRPTQAYNFNPAFTWLGDYEVTVEELLKGKWKNKPEQETAQPESQSDKARRLILATLDGGSVLAGDIEKLAEENGISMKTFNRVKADLGIISVSLNGRWYWQIPIEAEYTEVAEDGHGHENTVSMSISLLDGKVG